MFLTMSIGFPYYVGQEITLKTFIIRNCVMDNWRAWIWLYYENIYK